MDYEALRAGLQGAIPYNVHLGLEVAEVAAARGVVRLPDRPEIRNHVGSQHAGALFSAGEAASGAAFVGAFVERLGDITPLAESAEIAYRKLAQGVITATARLDTPADELLAKLDDEGVARFAVGVELANAQGDLVAEMTVRWHVRRNADS
jgi:acyl-coenzyme A thioesterase PaaI-like protein